MPLNLLLSDKSTSASTISVGSFSRTRIEALNTRQTISSRSILKPISAAASVPPTTISRPERLKYRLRLP
ncbi:MAG: hypothetical protein BWZ10_03336 [candidate division BRC1 bacterium ADurb.BinA364]|nr:MAG: hypothetical protein BWZ10_03336 [candidate division BRC1 bacterium ADurb.BinA364]